MYTEEFILTPKRMFMSTQSAKSEIFDYKQKATQLSRIQRNMIEKPEKRGLSSPNRNQHKL